MLERRGVKFETQTDTEVIPKLCKFLSDKFEESGEKDVTFRQLAMEVTRQLQGAQRLVFKSTKYPGELVAAKRGSPLLMGISDDSGEVSGVIEGGLSDGGEDDILHKKTIGRSSKKRKSMTGAAEIRLRRRLQIVRKLNSTLLRMRARWWSTPNGY